MRTLTFLQHRHSQMKRREENNFQSPPCLLEIKMTIATELSHPDED